MISNQETLNLSPYMAIYDIVVPKDNQLRKINDLVDFSFGISCHSHSHNPDTSPTIRLATCKEKPYDQVIGQTAFLFCSPVKK